MRLDINLASQPYEDARQFWMRWGTAVGVLGLLTLTLLGLVITGWNSARRDHATMAELRSMIADRDRLRTAAETTLNLPENRSTRDESQFLNQLIVRKSFSWTRVLESLENVMPPRVHVVSITPKLDDDNDLLISMTVAGDSRDRAFELARRMEESHRFANVTVLRAQHIESQTGDTVMAELAAIYIPELPESVSASSSTSIQAATDAKPKTPPASKAPTSKGAKH